MQAVGGGINLPLGASNYGIGRAFIPEGRPMTVDESVDASFHTITGNFFRALQIPLLAGRVFEERDNENAPKVVIVNESVAEALLWFAGKCAWQAPHYLARRKIPARNRRCGRRHQSQFARAETGEQIYVPHAQDPTWNFMGLVIRTAGDPAASSPCLRREVQALDKDQPLYNIRTMEDVVMSSLGTRRVSMQLFTVFACAALLLAAVGIYGVMAYSGHAADAGNRHSHGAWRAEERRAAHGR